LHRVKNIIEIENFREGGRKLVAVPVKTVKSKFVLYADDFNDLMSLGVSPHWHFYHNQAIVRNSGKEISIARLIRDARANQIVLAKDGNPFNLRRENLVIAPGSSKFRARDIIIRPYKKANIQIKRVN
jgi:hypothetical protein